MRKVISLILGSCLFCSVAVAKYNPPADRVTGSQRISMHQMNMYDKDGDGRLSPEEFGAKANVEETREMRRQRRKAKKEGIYQEPKEQFKTIDTNGDGYVSLKEMENYVSAQTKKTKGKVKYY